MDIGIRYLLQRLLGGRSGIAALEAGKVFPSFLRKSSKSEYLNKISVVEAQ